MWIIRNVLFVTDEKNELEPVVLTKKFLFFHLIRWLAVKLLRRLEVEDENTSKVNFVDLEIIDLRLGLLLTN